MQLRLKHLCLLVLELHWWNVYYNDYLHFFSYSRIWVFITCTCKGTPYWGGLGTIIGAVFGVGVIAYMEVGIIAIGWSGEWRQFFNGLIILLALLRS